MIEYTFVCSMTGEDQQVLVCEKCAESMPPVDGDRVLARNCDGPEYDLTEDDCDFAATTHLGIKRR